MNKEVLERKVSTFVKNQPGYSEAKVAIECENKNTWYILYGLDPQNGIAGFGNTAEQALADFKWNWMQYGGEAWLMANSGRGEDVF